VKYVVDQVTKVGRKEGDKGENDKIEEEGRQEVDKRKGGEMGGGNEYKRRLSGN
jgi:hypothetical protein